jgi:general secretion pathway protein D
MWAALLAALTGLGLVLDLRDVELSQLVDTVTRETGETVILDPSVTGRVTIIAEDELSPKEAREVLQAALLLSGYAMIPAPGGSYKVLRVESARGQAPFGPAGTADDSSDRLLVTLVRLESADARTLETMLRAGIIGAGLVFALPDTNSLILATTQAQIARLLAIIRALDEATATELRVLPLRYAQADATRTQIQEAIGSEASDEYRLIADARTNSLIVEGSPGRVRQVQDLLQTIDMPAPGRGELHVVRVRNADSESLATQLLSLRSGQVGQDALSGRDYDVVADAPTNSLLIRANPSVFGALSQVISELDHQPPSVVLDISIFEVDTSTSLQLGFDALIPLLVPDAPGDAVGVTLIGTLASLAAGGALQPGPFIARVVGEPILIPFIDENGVPQVLVAPKGAAQLTAAEGEATLLSLMNPHLLAASGEEQRIFTGQNVPIAQSGPGGTSDAFVTSVAIQRADVGVDLRVTPLVHDDNVELDLALTLSSVADSSEQSLAPATGPVLRKLDLRAKIHLVDGAVAMVASTPQENTQVSVAGVPWLSRIPVLGVLFRNTSEKTRRSNVLILAQATLVSTPSDDRAETLLRRLAFERQLERMRPLSTVTEAPYALLVTTRTNRADADAVAQALATHGTVEVVEWRRGDEDRFDVYLIGFTQLPELAAQAVKLRRAGYRPKMTVIVTE